MVSACVRARACVLTGTSWPRECRRRVSLHQKGQQPFAFTRPGAEHAIIWDGMDWIGLDGTRSESRMYTDLRLKCFPHVVQANGFSRVCDLTCRNRCSRLENDWKHQSQTSGPRSVVRVCNIFVGHGRQTGDMATMGMCLPRQVETRINQSSSNGS